MKGFELLSISGMVLIAIIVMVIVLLFAGNAFADILQMGSSIVFNMHDRLVGVVGGGLGGGGGASGSFSGT